MPATPRQDDGRFTDYFGSTDVIVTSGGVNDSGMFETNLRDERFLPFEGAGAISTWSLSLPAELRASTTRPSPTSSCTSATPRVTRVTRCAHRRQGTEEHAQHRELQRPGAAVLPAVRLPDRMVRVRQRQPETSPSTSTNSSSPMRPRSKAATHSRRADALRGRTASPSTAGPSPRQPRGRADAATLSGACKAPTARPHSACSPTARCWTGTQPTAQVFLVLQYHFTAS